MASLLGISLDKEDGQVVPDFASVRLACKVGVQAEINNIELYDNMISNETNEDV